MSTLPSKKYILPHQIPPPKITEEHFYEVQTTKCIKILYKTDTICPIVYYSISIHLSLLATTYIKKRTKQELAALNF